MRLMDMRTLTQHSGLESKMNPLGHSPSSNVDVDFGCRDSCQSRERYRMRYCTAHPNASRAIWQIKRSRGVPSPTFCGMQGIEFGMTRSLEP